MTTIPPLHLACKNGNHVEAQYLIGIGGCNINDEYNGETPFMYASIFGDGPDFSLLHFLIENGANIDHRNKNGESSLSMAVCTNRIDLVKELLRIGANKYTVDGDGENMLHIASGIGSLQLVKLFISHGIGINSLSNAGDTPLHLCIMYKKNIDVVKELLEYGANFRMKNFFGKSPLGIMIKYGDVESIDVILKRRLSSDSNLYTFLQN